MHRNNDPSYCTCCGADVYQEGTRWVLAEYKIVLTGYVYLGQV